MREASVGGDEGLTKYVCDECDRVFYVPPAAPKQRDGMAADGLSCPWCDGWSEPSDHHRDGARKRQPGRKRAATVAVAVAFACLLAVIGYFAWAEKEDDQEPAELAKALNAVLMSLETGLVAAEREGTPISGKFEVEDGKLQLSVYAVKGATFAEVIVDHVTGKIAKIEPITGGDDLRAAKAQREAMAKAQVSLREAIGTAVKANEAFRAVGVIPALKDGHPVAEITLLRGEEFKTVSEKLD